LAAQLRSRPARESQQAEKSEIRIRAHHSTVLTGGGTTGLVTGLVAPGAEAGVGVAVGPGAAFSGFVKKVTTLQDPDTEVPGRIANFPSFEASTPVRVKSPTFMIRDSRLRREKKSTTL
jgi:hypothetical protein